MAKTIKDIPAITVFQPQKVEAPPPDGIVRSTWKVGAYTLTITQLVDVPGRSYGTLRAEWEPKFPDVGELRIEDVEDYLRGRNEHLQRIANIIGSSVLVANL